MINVILGFYRILASIMVLLPLFINLTARGDVVASLVYAPVATILVLIAVIYFDEKLVTLLQGTHQRAKMPISNKRKVKARLKQYKCCFNRFI